MRDQERQDLHARTRKFALDVIRFCSGLTKTMVAQTMGRQLLKAGTSVGAHYREACRAKSDADFISKMEGALQEAEESVYWLELFVESGISSVEQTAPLAREGNELISMFVVMVRNVKSRGR